jgi:hypothetical protein
VGHDSHITWDTVDDETIHSIPPIQPSPFPIIIVMIGFRLDFTANLMMLKLLQIVHH